MRDGCRNALLSCVLVKSVAYTVAYTSIVQHARRLFEAFCCVDFDTIDYDVRASRAITSEKRK